MITTRSGGLLVAPALVLFGLAAPLAGQDDAPGIVRAALTADTVPFGDAFALEIDVRVSEGQAAFVPSHIPESPNLEPLASVEWSDEPLGAFRRVTLRYPMVGYRVGSIDVPGFEIVLGPPDAGGAATVAALEPEALAAAGTVEGRFLYRVPTQSAWILSLLSVEDVVAGLEPRPADDVIGRSWSRPALLSGLVFGSMLLGLVFVSGRDLALARARRKPTAAPPADPLAVAKAAALAALDRLLREGPRATGVEPFYEATSSAVRRYVEELEASWGPALTSTELMRGLATRPPSPPRGELLGEMSTAEVVKFGRLRPDERAALEHCRRLRDWVASS